MGQANSGQLRPVAFRAAKSGPGTGLEPVVFSLLWKLFVVVFGSRSTTGGYRGVATL